MTTLFAIGGGEIAEQETRAIDDAVVAATGSDTPRVLFVPTASGDADGYVETFESYYGDVLGCVTDVLELVDSAGNETATAEQVGAADAVYVGGGDTGYMLDVWRARGVDDLLREAWRDGTVMAGLSAGAICWFAGGLGDTGAAEDGDDGPVGGLGFVPDVHVVPHAGPDRLDGFADYLAVVGAAGVALEDEAALEVTDGRWRVHTSAADATAYRVPSGGDRDAVDELPSDAAYRPVSELQ